MFSNSLSIRQPFKLSKFILLVDGKYFEEATTVVMQTGVTGTVSKSMHRNNY